MINMMYLVLTALLALNVSAEVLNAFRTVNESIETSNKVVSTKNQATYDHFTAAEKDPETSLKAKSWAPSAYKAQQLSEALTKYIEQLKEQLIDASNPQMKDGVKEFTVGNLDAATRIFDAGGEGPKLYNSLGKFKTDLLNLLDPSNFPDQPQNVKDDLKRDRARFEKELPLDLSIPKSESGNAPSGNLPKDWTVNYFHMTPTIAALTILSKFQSDIKNSESQVIDYLYKQIGTVKLVYDKFDAIVSPSATYLMPGDELSIKAGIGAFSSAAKPNITINGAPQSVGTDGTAEWKTKVGNSGTVSVKIEYAKPDGSKETVTKEVKYTVGQPSGASVFLEKMNVLYVKEDNPVKISGGSVGREKVKVTFTNGEIQHTDGDSYNVIPTTAGEGKIIVDADGKKTEFPMRVKYLPNPTGFVGSHTGGPVPSAEFKVLGGVVAKLENTEFVSPFKVISYKIGGVGGKLPSYQEAVVDGPRWGGSASASKIAEAGPGAKIFIDELKVVGKDGRTRQLPSMVFDLK